MKKFICAVLCIGFLASCAGIEFNTGCDYRFDDYYFNKVKEFKETLIPENSIIMVGNSLTAGGKWKEYFPTKNIYNFGIPGDSSAGVLNRLPQLIEKKPYEIYLLIGVNDLRMDCNTEQIVQNYNTILWKLKKELPNTKVYITGLLPTDNKIRSNAEILQVNVELKRIATLTKHVYIDIYKDFLLGDVINPIYTYDGIHLTDKGYNIWVEKLRPYIIGKEIS